MPSSRSSVQATERPLLAPYWLLLLLATIVGAGLWLLYPRQDLERRLSQAGDQSALSTSYLHNLLRSDAIVIHDGPMHATNRPTLIFGNRGAVNPLQYLGMGASNPGTTSFGQLSTTAPSVAQGVQSLQGLYNYAGDVGNTNAQIGMNNSNQQANMYGALGGGLMKIGAQGLSNYYQNRG